jgi:hypothetical protein
VPHTSASYDATAFGTAGTVDDAYAFGRGEPLPLRLKFDPPGYQAPLLRISSPLDFIAVTDHAEALGEASLCYDENSESYDVLVNPMMCWCAACTGATGACRWRRNCSR